MSIKNWLPSVGHGLLGALISSSFCCLLPAVAIAIGLTGGLAASIVGLGKFRLYGILFGLGFMGASSWLKLRRTRSCCSEEEFRRRQITIPLTMLAAFAGFYTLIVYVIAPFLYKLP